MAAGLGYKEFATGDVLTAADANGYLASQVVMVFASAAARTSAIASPQEGMISYLKDTNSTEYYSGSAWVAVGATSSSGLTLINSTPFTTSSGVNVDSVFSATYRNYRIVIDYTSSVNISLYMRVRSGGTSYTTAKYETRGWVNGGSGITGSQTNTATEWLIGTGGGSHAGGSYDIYAPNIGTNITMTGLQSGITSGSYGGGSGASGYIDATYTADGFTIYPSSGTFTGIVKVYGYAN